MKRIIPTILSTFMLAAVGLVASPASVFASEPIDDPEFFEPGFEEEEIELKYWSFDELYEMDVATTAARAEACGEYNPACENKFISALTSESEDWWAWRRFADKFFLITSYNPSKNTMRLYYNDIDISRKLSGRSDWRKSLAELYLTWHDADQPEIDSIALTQIGLKSYLWHTAEIKQGIENPGVHIIYTDDEAKDGTNWFPAKQEIEISVENLDENTTNSIYYVYYIKNSMQYRTFNYSSCINSPDYVEGMECQLYLTNTDELVYFPVWPETLVAPEEETPTETPEEEIPVETPKENTPETPETESPTPEIPVETPEEDFPTKEETPVETPESSIPTETPVEQKPNISLEDVPILSTESDLTDNNIFVPLAPKTGQGTMIPESTAIKGEFPWWILASTTSALLLFGFFNLSKAEKTLKIHKNYRFLQKSLKKSKKTLDFPKKLR